MKRNNTNKPPNESLAFVNWIYSYFNENVPQITARPTLQEYNLPDNIDDIIEKRRKKTQKTKKIIFALLYIIGFILTLVFLLNNPKFDFSIFEAVGIIVGSYGWIALLIFALFGTHIENIIENIISLVSKNKEIAVLCEQYSKFTDAIYAYTYWEKTTKLNYWISLDGHQFEDAVAAVYRTNGYIAQVSKHGGDGGVDIILEKDGKTIAVQCKAHKKEIGPSVARDLYGTISHLGIHKGILVSRSGFTSGVYNFVQDKPIELVTLNDLMHMQSSVISNKYPKQFSVQKSSHYAVNSNVQNAKSKVEESVKTKEKKNRSSFSDNAVQLTFDDMHSFSNSNGISEEKSTFKAKYQTITPTSNTNLPQINIGTKVFHKSWGEGSIISKGISTFVVDFNGTEIKYTYPLSFQNGTLTIE